MFKILNQSMATFEMWIPFEGLYSTCSFITKGSFKHVSHRNRPLWLKQNMMQTVCCLSVSFHWARAIAEHTQLECI
jgi:hypothetical protein